MTIQTKEMTRVADVIGELGLNIAEAQKELNAGYIKSLVHLLALAKESLTVKAKFNAEQLKDFLASIAPPLYQYDRTTLEFAADMAQRSEKELSIGGSIGFGAVSLVGGYSSSTGQDYRSACKITTQMSAITEHTFAQSIVKEAAKATGDFKVTFEKASKADERLGKATKSLIEAFGGKADKIPEPK